LLLWVFWPSFNAINAKTEDARNRAILNTYLALVGSTVWTFLVSQALNPNRKFTVRHIGSASLAGAVAIAACADIVLQPVVAVIIGSVAGIFSVIAFQHITPFLDKKLNVHDTRGVFSLHGLPAIVGAVAGAIIVFLTAKESYGDRATNFLFPYVATGEREWGTQGLLQLAGIAIAAGIALIAGIITGLILRAPFWNQVRDKEYFADFDNFDVPADYDFTSRVISRIDRIELTEERIRLTGE
jgi:ammonium transporter Rh